jgi:hypothetical protein
MSSLPTELTNVLDSLFFFLMVYFGGVRISPDPHMRPLVMDVNGKFEGWPLHATAKFHLPAKLAMLNGMAASRYPAESRGNLAK